MQPYHVRELLQCCVGVTQLHHNGLHLHLYPLNLLEPQLVYLHDGEVGGCMELETLAVKLASNAWKTGHTDVCKVMVINWSLLFSDHQVS